MRKVFILMTAARVAIGSAQAAEPPAYVIPGRPGVPVMIYGYDASYTIVEGDWGLDRPGAMPPIITYGPRIGAQPLYYGPYFPRVGRQPGYGRHEIEPPANRRLPPRAESFRREWSTQSEELPTDLQSAVPPPPMVISPEFDHRRPTLRRRPR
jgi:hypothetical protein